ncbi:CBS domain-containing protein [Pyrococcus horikoshii]|uniref:CBS domain-containing protein n=2 Tax=Pyrococcus horikoshii TaxID=53953 RepID=O59501_PYRHO|nr:CBS domain-containing protein [Pyrococcus horikoshii]BAA30976.1 172aa long hypothetical protein [Pyrococcus horikoshii OT3]
MKKKILRIIGKRKLVLMSRREELSYNIKYISKVPVRIVMDKDFLKVRPETPLFDLISRFSSEETSAVVVDDEGKLIGFITMKDLLHYFVPPRRYSIAGFGMLKKYTLSRATRVEDIMIRRPIVINVNDDLGQAIKLMVETGKHHLPVIDRERRVHGLLEVKDIIRLIRIVSS